MAATQYWAYQHPIDDEPLGLWRSGSDENGNPVHEYVRINDDYQWTVDQNGDLYAMLDKLNSPDGGPLVPISQPEAERVRAAWIEG